jgi:hypothetical protein
MGKAPSDATILRRVRAELRKWKTRALNSESLYQTIKDRAEKAESECIQWKARFDGLLQVTKQPRNQISAEQHSERTP